MNYLLRSTPVVIPALRHRKMMPQMYGMGCCGCNQGMGLLTMDGTGLLGTGLFANATDLSTWGWGEYLVLGFGIYTLFALTSTTKRSYRTARRKLRRAS